MKNDCEKQICKVMAENMILRTKLETFRRENEKLKSLLREATDVISLLDCDNDVNCCKYCQHDHKECFGDDYFEWKRAKEVGKLV